MDNLGNRTSVTKRDTATDTYALDSATNRYDLSTGGPYYVTCASDAAGNTTQDKAGYQYTYDYENRVVKIEDVNDVEVATYAYDALGRRIKMIDSIASTSTLYYYNPDWQVLAEYDGSNNLQRYSIYGNYIDEPLVMHRQSDGEDYYYGQDHLYSTVILLDDSGSVVERCEYDAYGSVLVYTDDGNDDTWFTGDDTTANASAKGNPYTFTGRRLDVLDGGDLVRMHYRYRDYDVYMAAFLQHDLLGYLESLNLYQYAGSMPIAWSDPFGLSSCASNCSPVGSIRLEVVDFIITKHRHSPHAGDIMSAAKLGLDIIFWLQIINAIATGSPDDLPMLGVPGNIVDAIEAISEEIGSAGFDAYLKVDKQECEKKRCWPFFWRCKLVWMRIGRPKYFQCTAGSYVESGLYPTFSAAVDAYEDCLTEFEESEEYESWQ